MATVHCHKTCEESCQQKSHHGFGEKVADFFKGHHHNETTKTHTQQYSAQTTTLAHSGHTKSQTHCGCTQTQATHHHSNTKCQATNRRDHKKGVLHKIKDRLSDHSSDDSSDSDSDNENCHKRKAMEFDGNAEANMSGVEIVDARCNIDCYENNRSAGRRNHYLE
ncbi:hypothetical protein Fmac_003969 [Flemingia macrophylla]|uniref:Uncharacterized protein n=1 Tax=Flemingia macrophylla TaxID=520843 RepID=A0ABD1N3M9_9FABA